MPWTDLNALDKVFSERGLTTSNHIKHSKNFHRYLKESYLNSF